MSVGGRICGAFRVCVCVCCLIVAVAKTGPTGSICIIIMFWWLVAAGVSVSLTLIIAILLDQFEYESHVVEKFLGLFPSAKTLHVVLAEAEEIFGDKVAPRVFNITLPGYRCRIIYVRVRQRPQSQRGRGYKCEKETQEETGEAERQTDPEAGMDRGGSSCEANG